MDNGKELALLNTHLSAFSNNDGTLFEQVGQIDRHLMALEDSGVAWVLGGDFNALPPGDDVKRLAEEGASYGPETPMTKLYDRYTPIWTERMVRDAPKQSALTCRLAQLSQTDHRLWICGPRSGPPGSGSASGARHQ
jgi:hypothetical protein